MLLELRIGRCCPAHGYRAASRSRVVL